MAVGNAVIEAACASLVREYLSKKGFKSTLEKMDEECPRNELSISNRQALMKHINLHKLVKRNQAEKEPLKAMLEIMTKHFMECLPHGSVQHMKECESSQGSISECQLDISYSHKVNQLAQPSLTKSMKPDATSLATKREREKTYSDLIVDEDVEGETIIGNGRDGIMTVETTESPPLCYAPKTQASRPVSAKRGGDSIFSNDDVMAMRRRSHKVKLLRASAIQQEQRDTGNNFTEGSSHNSPKFQNNKAVANNGTLGDLLSMEALRTNDSHTFKPNKVVKKPSDTTPASFEALLMKGEEKASLLNRKVLDPKNDLKSDFKAGISSTMDGKMLKKGKQKRELDAQNSPHMVDLDFREVEDLDIGGLELKSVSPVVRKALKPIAVQSTPIDLKTAIVLKNLVLGSPNQQYTNEWRLQSYSFCDIHNIKYGLVQKKSGPCGVIAAVQACVLQEMLFGMNKLPEAKFKNPSRGDRSKALALALSTIFWRAGDCSQAVVTILSQTAHLPNSAKFKQDNVTEKLSICTFTNFEELSNFMIQSVSQFETDRSPGVILTLYSAILSRKPHLVRADFDVSEQTTFIGFHGYCTQVGSYYKTPKNPIWVVCSESHFTVLFSACKDLINDWKAERRFDLFYFDGLARQQEEIKLTVSTVNQSYKPEISDEDLVPPLELCIRTKWADAEIDWNGFEPIL
ncbi:hypothetical protein BsWGS_02034 [Bradybaena similaris]